MWKIPAEIQSGKFACKCFLDSQVGRSFKKSLEKMEAEHLIEQGVTELRAMLPWLQKK